MCDFASHLYPSLSLAKWSAASDPVELCLLSEDLSFAKQRAVYLRVIRETAIESHRLRLMLLQEMHERHQDSRDRKKKAHVIPPEPEVEAADRGVIESESSVLEPTRDECSLSENSQREQARKMSFYLEKLRQDVLEKEKTISQFKQEL